MLINLVPDFLAVLDAADRHAAYLEYFERHRPLLTAYWDNYVLEPTGPHFEDVVRATVAADRSDLRALLANTDLMALARQTEEKVRTLLDVDVAYDIVLMVGVGAANAGDWSSTGAVSPSSASSTSPASPIRTRRGLVSTLS